jgi:L-asparaginase II
MSPFKIKGPSFSSFSDKSNCSAPDRETELEKFSQKYSRMPTQQTIGARRAAAQATHLRLVLC